MRAPRLGPAVLALLALLVVCNTAIVVRVELQTRTIHRANPWRQFAGRRALPAPSGYGPSGARIALKAVAGARCWSVRYSSPGCEFCRADDHGGWAQLAHKLGNWGCKSFVVPPTRQAAFGKVQTVPADATRIEFLSVAWLRVPLSVLPTTLLFGPSGRLVWQHQGELSAGDPSAAIAALSAAAKSAAGVK